MSHGLSIGSNLEEFGHYIWIFLSSMFILPYSACPFCHHMMMWWRGNTFCITGVIKQIPLLLRITETLFSCWTSLHSYLAEVTGGFLLWFWIQNMEQNLIIHAGIYNFDVHIDGLVQERHNSSALAMELCLSCTNPSIWRHLVNIGSAKSIICHQFYHGALSHRYFA